MNISIPNLTVNLVLHSLQRFTMQAMRAGSVIERHREMLEQRFTMFVYQCFRLGIVLLSILGVGMVNYFWPGFFDYQYFSWTVNGSDLVKYLPMVLWAVVLSTFFGEKVYSSRFDVPLLLSGLGVGNMAALWEELGYRCYFICFAMVSVLFSNWLFDFWLTSILLLALGGLVLFTMIFGETKEPLTVKSFIGALYIFLFAGFSLFTNTPDPVFWMYATVLLPLLDFVSFGSFTDIIQNAMEHGPLFLMGAIAANFWFRDGHKYQGTFGYYHSWFIGFILIYTMMTYGLMTAIVVHGMWNTTIYIVRYGKRKLQ